MLRLDTMLRSLHGTPETTVVEQRDFRRSHQNLKWEAGIEAEVLSDHSRTHGITIIHAQLRPPDTGELLLGFDDARAAGHGRGYLTRHPSGGIVWLPTLPVTRQYDRAARIAAEEPGQLTCCESPGRLEVRVNVGAGSVVDIPLVHEHDPGHTLAGEIATAHPIERVRLQQDDWYDVQSVSQLWDYLIHGRIHDPRWKSTGTRVECQQCAHTWYAHLGYLHRVTGKRLYATLRDVVAHTVLWSLPRDHRWRHGSWTDGMETHTRFQTDGIHLLLDHYAASGQRAFLDSACGAANYLIRIADTLDDGARWYVHDTLEISDTPERAGYPLRRRSRAFGKHPGNTLCLNTHVWTLTAFHRLATVCRDDRRQSYEDALARGMRALNNVLSARTADSLYRSLYALRDACLHWKARSGASLPLRLCDAALHRLLRHLKPRLPRLVMPNGYIERDLERTTLSDRYVPVNLKDLALLSRLTGCGWIRPFVRYGLGHWMSSGLSHKEVPTSVTAQQALDAALLLAVDDPGGRDVAHKILEEMTLAGRAITVDALAGTAGDDAWTLPRLMPDVMDELLSKP